MYLLDTNIWLEVLLDQEKSGEVQSFFARINDTFYISDFSLFSIGIILFRLKKVTIFSDFIRDVFINGGVRIIHLEINDLSRLFEIQNQYNLDFDDSYQYTIAEKYRFTLLSYDHDFDKTERGRRTPGDILSNDK